MTEKFPVFPKDFIWGAATAAYQIEGAATADGRGPSIWDTFSHTPGKVKNGETGDIACDHYHRWPDDIKLMQKLGISAYRFSIAWPRIFPQGRGTVNEPGLAFYDKLVDALLAAHITPYVTLYHWDLPQALQDENGWLRRGIVDDFTAYADVMSRRLGDRVKHWITFNEPWVFTWLGYTLGVHAPGYTGFPTDSLQATHHVYLAHGAAVPVIRANSPGAQVGITLNLSHVDPHTPTATDEQAAVRYDGWANRWYLDPLFKGQYPQDMTATYSVFMPEIQPGDMEQIATPIDFLGVNYYSRAVVAHDADGFELQIRQVEMPGEKTEMGWEVYPHGLYALLRRLHEDYQPKAMFITENGAAFPDTISADGHVHDEKRVQYLAEHFQAASHAVHDGVPLKGYFVWSLLDNFEWAEGYSRRFGIHYVDYTTQQRIPKDSALYMTEMIRKGTAHGGR